MQGARLSRVESGLFATSRPTARPLPTWGVVVYPWHHQAPSLPNSTTPILANANRTLAHNRQCATSGMSPDASRGACRARYPITTPRPQPSHPTHWMAFHALLVCSVAILSTLPSTLPRCKPFFSHPPSTVLLPNYSGKIRDSIGFPLDGVAEYRYTLHMSYSQSRNETGAETMTDGGIAQLAADVSSGTFTPTYACPNGTACWLVFGMPGDHGTPTGRGPRRVVHCLTGQIEAVLPELVDRAMREVGAR